MSNANAAVPKSSSKGINIALWAAQGLLSLTFVGTALWKLATPIPQLAAMIPWMGQVSPGFLYMTALFDFLGGVGVLAPSITRIKPSVAVLAAIGCIALQVAAIIFHFSRREAVNTPFNFFLIALSLFVAWGRYSRAHIEPRS